jgi:hypothetical protein
LRLAVKGIWCKDMAEIKTHIFLEFMQSLEEMEAKREVDRNTSIEKINELVSLFGESEHLWSKDKKTPIDIAFVMYLASRNSRMILEKMGDRFGEPKLANPKVAVDSARIIPALLDLYVNLVSAEKQAPSVNFILPTRMLHSIYSLRKIASEIDMLPSIAEELKDIPRETIRKEFSDLDVRIWGMTAYEFY